MALNGAATSFVSIPKKPPTEMITADSWPFLFTKTSTISPILYSEWSLTFCLYQSVIVTPSPGIVVKRASPDIAEVMAVGSAAKIAVLANNVNAVAKNTRFILFGPFYDSRQGCLRGKPAIPEKPLTRAPAHFRSVTSDKAELGYYGPRRVVLVPEVCRRLRHRYRGLARW